MPGPERPESRRSAAASSARKASIVKSRVLTASERSEEGHRMPADFSDDDQFNDNASNNSGSSQFTEGGSPKITTRIKGMAHNVKAAIDKRLHLELFGITWFDFAAISCARWFFLLALGGAAAGLATSVYLKLSAEDTDNFNSEFEDLANEILELSNDKAVSVFRIMAGLATAITSSIGQQSFSSVYPRSFHTLPDMEKQFGTARNATGALVLAYSPLVQANELGDWAAYSEENQGWIENINQAVRLDYNDSEPILPFIWDYAPDDTDHAYLKSCNSSANPISVQPTNTRFLEHTNDPDEPDVRIPLLPRDGPFSPLWTYSPGPPAQDTQNINHDLFAKPNLEAALRSVDLARKPMFLDVCNLAIWFDDFEFTDEMKLEAVIGYPIFASFEPEAPVVGNLIEIFAWQLFFENILSDPDRPVMVVLQSSCNDTATFKVAGPQATLVANDDVHDTAFDNMARSAPFADFANPPELVALEEIQGVCSFTMTVYPTQQLQDQFESNQPLWFAMVVLSVFLATSILFFLFDRLMTRQRNNIMNTAKKQNLIVSSLFPKSVQAKILEQVEADQNNLRAIGKAGLRQYINDEEAADGEKQKQAQQHRGIGIADKSKPIADLFPETTIMFGDIAGFTAWSSARDPSQVFVLLETIYHEFDAIAKRRKVFKVEVIGDCYVAVCGLPDPRPDHAVVMCKFATDCVNEMNRLCQELEVELGPDTTELGFRVGLHSGPVVAGVLRGEKSRFQLFGDTMNTAARMESTGIPNRIQISQETADLLEMYNKGNWFEPRQDKVEAKGKGTLTTFLLKIHKKQESAGYASESDTQSVASSMNSMTRDDTGRATDKRNRIADWTVEVLADLLQEIEVRRRAQQTKSEPTHKLLQMEQSSTYTGDKTVIDDVKEIIELPEFNVAVAEREAKLKPEEIKLSDDVLEELRTFVRTIASMYHDNPFHNFPHANHVTMSVVKLLGRIQAPDVDEVHTTLHDHTYGITSDPLTRFAVVFSALIHDVDHMGVSNMQLVKEQDPLAELYKNKSVAEQNSIDIAWDLLMEPRFDNLRRQIYTTEAEFKRFRQLVINTVLATDIMDKDLKELRNKRWANAFSDDNDKDTRQNINRKATIVIEHLIQASDVAHTMQHWHIYRKWNERLFQELYRAWEAGRLDNDPSLGWYKGEMGFFDFYIIPLAKKLKECGVFGVSSDEYLSYAVQNRKEWEARGEEIVDEMLKNINRKRVANSVYAASQENVDQEGQEIVAEMSRSIRRASQLQMPQKQQLPDAVTFVQDPEQGSTATNSSGRDNLDDDDEHDNGVSDDDSEYEVQLEMKLKPM